METIELLLGNKVKDLITGFEGIATGKCIYLNGCVQYLVQPTKLKDGQEVKPKWIDIQQLEFVSKGVAIRQYNTGGGERSHPPTE